eukprot:GHVN01074058.1.p1 GENE.GHVN01074058.1~~GHVN01074058.1.p1  ORF type:complete len:209 (-),score=27.68 GHVN01074058.1:1596-2222(-)
MTHRQPSIEILGRRRCCCCMGCEKDGLFEYIPCQSFPTDHDWVCEKVAHLNDIYHDHHQFHFMIAIILVLFLTPVGLMMLALMRTRIFARDTAAKLASECEMLNQSSREFGKGVKFTVFSRGRRVVLLLSTVMVQPGGHHGTPKGFSKDHMGHNREDTGVPPSYESLPPVGHHNYNQLGYFDQPEAEPSPSGVDIRQVQYPRFDDAKV